MIGCGPRQVLVVPKRMVTLHCRWCRRPGDFRWSGRSLQSWQSSAVLFSRHHFRCCCSQSIHFIRVMIIILMEAAKITIHLSRTESLQWSANNLTGKIMQVVTHHASYTSVDPCSPVVVASEAKKTNIIRTLLSSQIAGSTRLTALNVSNRPPSFACTNLYRLGLTH